MNGHHSLSGLVHMAITRTKVLSVTVLVGIAAIGWLVLWARSRSTQTEISSAVSISLPSDQQKLAQAQNRPTQLWLGIVKHKEHPPFYRHAWGTAVVSTNPKFTDRYPVRSLRLLIAMPAVTGDMVCEQSTNTAAEAPAECLRRGIVFGSFTSHWQAWASDPVFGSWQTPEQAW
jgi:hypothetical protein